MRHPALLPLLAVFAGLLAAVFVEAPRGWLAILSLLLVYAAAAGALVGRWRCYLPLVVAGFVHAAWLIGSASNADARASELIRTCSNLPPDARPLVVEGVLREDASPAAVGGATLSLAVTALESHAMAGGVVVSVSGGLALDRLDDWRRGRAVRASMSLREPTVYRNPGLRDERAALARRGIHLFGTVKSATLVEAVRRGGWWDERAADARAFTRRAVSRGVGRWSARSAAIVVAILIGDRAGLGVDVERRLQEAGTYHVIAISGGNIAILAGFLLGACRLAAVRPRAAAGLTGVLLVAYASVVGGGASVNRATFMAAVYLAALAVDVRGATINALLGAAAVLLCVTPLSLYDVAFAMTCGATLGILVAGRRMSNLMPRRGWLAAPVSLLVASAAAECALLPVGAWAFSRVTFAGLLLNFLAIPLMAVAQLAGLAVLPLSLVSQSLADAAGLFAHIGADGLVRTAGFVDVVPMLTWRVPPPSVVVIAAYYLGWLLLIGRPRLGRGDGSSRLPPGTLRLLTPRAIPIVACVVLLVSSTSILWSPVARWRGARPTGRLRVTVVDVGQADSILLQFPDGRAWLVDAGGSRAGGTFDVGGRVIEPALWYHGVFRLDRFVLTHGDPDHLGGAPALMHDFRVREFWEGIDVPRDAALQQLRAQAVRRGTLSRFVRAGESVEVGGVVVRICHPPPPDWERQKVRNDDSVVLHLRFGSVGILLTGDIGRDVEKEVAARLPPAPLLVVKVPHHGSVGSSSPPFLAATRPAAALLTVGAIRLPRPSLDAVVARYTSMGVEVFRTDADGAIDIETDGREVRVATFAGRAWTIAPRR